MPYGCFALYYGYDMSDNELRAARGCETPAEAPEAWRRRPSRRPPTAKIAYPRRDCVTSVQKAWEEIWADEELGAQRAFTVDFEAYLPGEDMSCADIDVFVALR